MTASHEAYIKSLEDQIVALEKMSAAQAELTDIIIKKATWHEMEYRQEIARLRGMLEKKGVYFLEPDAEFEG